MQDLQMLYELGKAFNTFIRHQGYTKCILVSNTEFKHNLCLFKKTPQGTFKAKIIFISL